MCDFREKQKVVYRAGFTGTRLSEEGRSLDKRLRQPAVRGIVTSVGVNEVHIEADNPQDSGWFPADKVELDFSDRPVF